MLNLQFCRSILIHNHPLSILIVSEMAPTPTKCNHFYEHFTVFTKPTNILIFNKLHISCSSNQFYPLLNYERKKSHYSPSSNLQYSIQKTKKNPSLEQKQFNQKLIKKTPSSFVENVKKKKQADPLEMLKEDGDWSKEQFWGVIKFLKQSSRTSEILQVFDSWKDLEKSRINEENYEKIICLLLAAGLTDAAISALEQMKSHGIRSSLEIYKLVINGFARIGRFDDALFYLEELKNSGLKPDTETYDGLIQAYGRYKMYDEMGRCLREMKFSGCSPDHVTYNLLIREFAKAGLLNKMERTHQALLTNRMDLQTSTLVVMLETYANFGILDKMEKVFRRILNSKACLQEDLIRKLAGVYIENLMFSRLDDLGLELSSRIGCSDLVWCLRLLSHACNLSKKGMYSIIEEMELEEVPWNVTIVNIMALAYLKMKDFKQLQVLLSELPSRYVKPDIITVGLLFDACMSGFRDTPVKNTWARAGFFDDKVEMNTDALVLVAFGKGQFLRDFEEIYSLFEANAKKKRTWTYRHLIDLVKTRSNTQLMAG